MIKNICTKFHEKTLNSYHKIEQHIQKWAQNTLKWLPETEDENEVTERVIPRIPVQNLV